MQSRSSIHNSNSSSQKSFYASPNTRQSPMAVEMDSPISPMTPSTPPYQIGKASGALRRLEESARVSYQSSTRPRSRVGDAEDEDEKMLNRISMDSSASTIPGGSEEDDDTPWLESELAILNRTLEEGQPPNTDKRIAPRTPYHLSAIPENLLDKWARQIKQTQIWPHSVKETRRMLRNLAKIVVSERRGAAHLSDSDRDDPDDWMEYEGTALDQTLRDPRPRRVKDTSRVERAALRLKATEQILNINPIGFHPYAHSRLRSPLKPRSPPVEATSPVDSYFPTSPIFDGRRRSRSASPNGDGRHSPTKPLLETPSLSPMKLSPRKKSIDDFDEPTTHLASLSGVGSKRSGSRSSIPSAFYTPALQLPHSQLQPPQGSNDALGFPQLDTDDSLTAGSSAAGSAAQFSSVSSASSVALANPNPPQPLPKPKRRIDNHDQPIPNLPMPTVLSSRHPHLADNFGARNGIKRSSSFSRPPDPIKRAPSYPNYGDLKERQGLKPAPPSPMTEEPTIPLVVVGHKRERSPSSVDGSGSGYDTEDVPPSSAPSSGPIPPLSPLGAAFNFSPSPSPKKSGLDFLPGASRLLTSPSLLPAKLFGRKKGVRPKDRGGRTTHDSSDRERTSSPSPPPTLSSASRDVTLSPVSERPSAMDSTRLMPLNATPDVRMHLDETPRPRVMSTPRMPRKASAEFRSVRQSPIGPRKDGEPRRKRVKTDELATPPRELRSSFSSPQNEPGRALSSPPRSQPRTPPRRPRVSGSLKTPPRRSLRSPRLLPGGGRTIPVVDKPTRSTRSISPLPLPTTTLTAGSPTFLTDRLRSRSPNAVNSMMSASPTGAIADNDSIRTRSSSLLMSRRTVSPTIDEEDSNTLRPKRASLRSATKLPDGTVSRSIKGSVTVGRAVGKSLPKRDPSFFGEELGAKPQPAGTGDATEETVRSKTVRRVGTTKFPAAGTASISSVLFPGGREDLLALSRRDPPHVGNAGVQAPVGTIGSGEESVIRAGEHAAQARKPQDVRASLRSSTGIGFGRSKMTRSISMLGPGERPKPY